jgi:capsular polysaccharide biosynthesis protein
MPQYTQLDEINDEIDLLELFQLFMDNLFLIIGLSVIGFILAFAYTTFLVKPTYSSESTVFIQPTVKENQVSASDLTTNQKLTATYTQIAKSNKVLDQVWPSFRTELTKKQISSAVTIKSIGDTQIISFSAITNDPRLSMSLVNNVVDVFMLEVKDIMEIDNLTILDRGQLNEDKVGPNTTINVVIGTMLGFMLGVGIALLKMLLNRTIQTRYDAEKLLNLPVLGEIHYNE